MNRLFVDRTGFWLWLFGYGLAARVHSKNPMVYSERQRVRCRVWIVGPLRVTLRFPNPLTHPTKMH
jgi:hypothetical protein